MRNESTTSPVSETCFSRKLLPSISTRLNECTCGNELARERLPACRIALLLGVVETGAAGSAHNVNHAVGLPARAIAERLIQLPFACDFTPSGRTPRHPAAAAAKR
jgi:hypothetical protein